MDIRVAQYCFGRCQGVLGTFSARKRAKLASVCPGRECREVLKHDGRTRRLTVVRACFFFFSAAPSVLSVVHEENLLRTNMYCK